VDQSESYNGAGRRLLPIRRALAVWRTSHRPSNKLRLVGEVVFVVFKFILILVFESLAGTLRHFTPIFTIVIVREVATNAARFQGHRRILSPAGKKSS